MLHHEVGSAFGPWQNRQKRNIRVIAKIIITLFILGITELATLLWLASQAGWLFALGEILVTLLLGLAIIRWVGIFSLTAIPREALRDDLPIPAPSDPLILLLAAVLLMLPGLITDCLGLLLVFPPTRQLLKLMTLWYLEKKFFPGRSSRPTRSEYFDPERDVEISSDEVIDVEFHRIS